MLKSLPPLMTIQEYLEYRPETARIIGVLSKDEDGYYRIEDDMYTIYLHNLDEGVGKKIEPLIGKEVVVFKKDNKFIKVMPYREKTETSAPKKQKDEEIIEKIEEEIFSPEMEKLAQEILEEDFSEMEENSLEKVYPSENSAKESSKETSIPDTKQGFNNAFKNLQTSVENQPIQSAVESEKIEKEIKNLSIKIDKVEESINQFYQDLIDITLKLVFIYKELKKNNSYLSRIKSLETKVENCKNITYINIVLTGLNLLILIDLLLKVKK